jgi:Transposase, Mutator family
MTDDRMALLELVEKGADADLVRQMLAFAAERIMEAEAETAAGAAKGARPPLREAHRNGYRARTGLGHPRRPDRAGHPAAAQGLLPPELLGAAPDRREGLGGGGAGGLRPWRLDARRR